MFLSWCGVYLFQVERLKSIGGDQINDFGAVNTINQGAICRFMVLTQMLRIYSQIFIFSFLTTLNLYCINILY
jgi:hypothetical protein